MLCIFIASAPIPQQSQVKLLESTMHGYAAKSHWYNTYNVEAAVCYSGEPVPQWITAWAISLTMLPISSVS